MGILDKIEDTTKSLIKGVTESIEDSAKFVGDTVSTVADKGVEFGHVVSDMASDAVESASEFGKDIEDKIIEYKPYVEAAGNMVGDIVKYNPYNIGSTFKGLYDPEFRKEYADKLVGAGEIMIDSADKFSDYVGEGFHNIGSYLENTDTIYGEADNMIAKTTNLGVKAIGGLSNIIGDIVSDPYDNTVEFIQGVTSRDNQGEDIYKEEGIDYINDKGAKLNESMTGMEKFSDMLEGFGKLSEMGYRKIWSTLGIADNYSDNEFGNTVAGALKQGVDKNDFGITYREFNSKFEDTAQRYDAIQKTSKKEFGDYFNYLDQQDLYVKQNLPKDIDVTQREGVVKDLSIEFAKKLNKTELDKIIKQQNEFNESDYKKDLYSIEKKTEELTEQYNKFLDENIKVVPGKTKTEVLSENFKRVEENNKDSKFREVNNIYRKQVENKYSGLLKINSNIISNTELRKVYDVVLENETSRNKYYDELLNQIKQHKGFAGNVAIDNLKKLKEADNIADKYDKLTLELWSEALRDNAEFRKMDIDDKSKYIDELVLDKLSESEKEKYSRQEDYKLNIDQILKTGKSGEHIYNALGDIKDLNLGEAGVELLKATGYGIGVFGDSMTRIIKTVEPTIEKVGKTFNYDDSNIHEYKLLAETRSIRQANDNLAKEVFTAALLNLDDLFGSLGSASKASRAINTVENLSLKGVSKLGKLASDVNNKLSKIGSIGDKMTNKIKIGGKVLNIISKKKDKLGLDKITGQVRRTGKWALDSVVTGAAANPTFDRLNSEASNDSQQVFNAITDIFFDAGLFAGAVTGRKGLQEVLFDYRFGFGDGKEILNDFIIAYKNKTGETISVKEAGNLLTGTNKLVDSIMVKSPEGVKSKNDMYRFLSDNLLEMDKNKLKKMVTSNGMGIEIEDAITLSNKSSTYANDLNSKLSKELSAEYRGSRLSSLLKKSEPTIKEKTELEKLIGLYEYKTGKKFDLNNNEFIKDVIENTDKYSKYIGVTDAQVKGYKSAYEGYVNSVDSFINGKGALYGNTLSRVPNVEKADARILLKKAKESFGKSSFKINNEKLQKKIVELSENYGDIKTKEVVSLYSSYGEVKIPKDKIQHFLGVDLKEFEERYAKDPDVTFTFKTNDGLKDTDQVFNNLDGRPKQIEFRLNDSLLDKKKTAIINKYRDDIKKAFTDFDDEGNLKKVVDSKGLEQDIDRYMERVLIQKFKQLTNGGMEVTIGNKVNGLDKAAKPDNREAYFLIRMAEEYFGDLLKPSKNSQTLEGIDKMIQDIDETVGTSEYYRKLSDHYVNRYTDLGETVLKDPTEILRNGMLREGYFGITLGSPKIENKYRNHMLYLTPGKEIIEKYEGIKHYFDKTLNTKYGDRKEKGRVVKGPKFHTLFRQDMNTFMSDFYKYGFKDELGNIIDVDKTLQYVNIKGSYGKDTPESIRSEMIKYFGLKESDEIVKTYDGVVEFLLKQGDDDTLNSTFIKNFSYNFFNNIEGVTKILKDFNGTNKSIANVARLILSDKLVTGIAEKSFKELITNDSLVKLLKNKYDNVKVRLEYNIFKLKKEIDKYNNILTRLDNNLDSTHIKDIIINLEKAKKKLVKQSKVSFENYVKDNLNIIGTEQGVKIVNNYRKKLVNKTVNLVPEDLPKLKQTLSELINDKDVLYKQLNLIQEVIKDIEVGFTTGNISEVSKKISKITNEKAKNFLYNMIDKYKEVEIDVSLKDTIDEKKIYENLGDYKQGIYSYEIFKRDNPIKFDISSVFTKQINEEALNRFNSFLKDKLDIKGGIGSKTYLDFNMAKFYNENKAFKKWVDGFIYDSVKIKKGAYRVKINQEYRKFIDTMFPDGDIKVKKDGEIIDITEEIKKGLYKDSSILDKFKRLRLVDTERHTSFSLRKETFVNEKTGKEITYNVAESKSIDGMIVPHQFIKMKYGRHTNISKGINNARKGKTRGMDVRYVSGIESSILTKLRVSVGNGVTKSLVKLITKGKDFKPSLDELYKSGEEYMKDIFNLVNRENTNNSKLARKELGLEKGEILVGGFGDKDGFGVIYKNDNIKFSKDVSVQDRGDILQLAYFLEYAFQTGYHTDIKLPDNLLDNLLNKTHNSFDEFYDDVLSYGIDGKKTDVLENTFVYNLSDGYKTKSEGTLLERAKGSLESAIKTVRKREAFNTYEKNLFDDVERLLTGYVLKKVIKTNPEITKALNLGDLILNKIKKGLNVSNDITVYFNTLKENELREGEFNNVIRQHNDDGIDINKVIDINLFKKVHEDYIRTYGGDLEDGASYASKNLGVELSKIRGHEFKEDIKSHIVGETINNARTGGKNLIGFEEVKIDGKKVDDVILIGEESLKLKGGYKPYEKGVTKKVTIGGREYEIIGEIEGLGTSSFKEAGSTAHESGDSVTSGLSLITRFEKEYQEAFSYEMRKDIKQLYDDFIASLNNNEISNLGFGDINRFIESVVSGTGLGKYSDEVLNNKVESFLYDVNQILKETKLDGQEMYAKRADHNVGETEIVISSKSKLFKGMESKQKEVVDTLIEKIKIETDEQSLKELEEKLAYEKGILDNKDYKVIAYRFPVPSKYNPGVYNIKIDDSLSSEAMIGNPRSFFIKMESDFDGDHIFLSGIENKYSKIIAEGILGVEPNTDIKKLRSIISEKQTNDYILAKQVDKGKVVDVDKRYSIVDSRLAAVEAKNSIGIVSAFMRSLGSILYYKDKGYLSSFKGVDNTVKNGDILYKLNGKDRTLSKTLNDISKGYIFKGINDDIKKLAKDNINKDFKDLPNKLKSFIENAVSEKNKGYLIDENYPELKSLYEGGMSKIKLGKEFAELGSSTLQTTLDFGNSGLAKFNKNWMKEMFESVGIQGESILKVIETINNMSTNYKNPVYSSLKETINPLSKIRKLSGVNKENMLFLHRGGDDRPLLNGFKGIGRLMEDINYSSSIDFLFSRLGKELGLTDKIFNDLRKSFDFIYKGEIKNVDSLGKINFLTKDGKNALRAILDQNFFTSGKKVVEILSTEENILFNKFKETGKISDNDTDKLRIVESLYLKTIDKEQRNQLKELWGVNSIYGIANLLSDKMLIDYLKVSDERAITHLKDYIELNSTDITIKQADEIIGNLKNKLKELSIAADNSMLEEGINKSLLIKDIQEQIKTYEKKIDEANKKLDIDELKVETLSDKINDDILNSPISIKQPINYNTEYIYSSENVSKILGVKDYFKNLKTKAISLKIVSDIETKAPELLNIYNRVADFSENFGVDHIARTNNILSVSIEKKINELLGYKYFLNRGEQGENFVRIMKNVFQNSIHIKNGKYVTVTKEDFIRNSIEVFISKENTIAKQKLYDLPYNDKELNDVLGHYYDDINVKIVDYMNKYSDRYNGDIQFKKIYNPSNKFIVVDGERKYIDKQIKLETNIIDDILKSSTGDGNLATNAFGWTDRETMIEGLKALGYNEGNLIDRAEELYSFMKKKESVTASKVFGVFASFYYSAKYGKLSLLFGQGGLIMSASQMLPNLTEILKTVRNSDLLDDALLIQKRYGLLESENTLTKGSSSAGTELNIATDDYIVGRLTHETIPDYLERLNISRKTGDKIGTETHRLYEIAVNPLGGTDSVLDDIRRQAAIADTMDMFGVKSYSDLVLKINEGGEKVLDLFRNRVRHNYNSMGGGVGSASELYRTNKITSYNNSGSSNSAFMRVFKQLVSGGLGFLQNWSYHKAATFIEFEQSGLTGLYKMFKGDFKGAKNDLADFYHYNRMLTELSLSALGLYMKFEQYNTSEDYNDKDKFIQGFNNTLVAFEIAGGNMVEDFNTAQDLNNNDISSSAQYMMGNKILSMTKVLKTAGLAEGIFDNWHKLEGNGKTKTENLKDATINALEYFGGSYTRFNALETLNDGFTYESKKKGSSLLFLGSSTQENEIEEYLMKGKRFLYSQGDKSFIGSILGIGRYDRLVNNELMQDIRKGLEEDIKYRNTIELGFGGVGILASDLVGNSGKEMNRDELDRLNSIYKYMGYGRDNNVGKDGFKELDGNLKDITGPLEKERTTLLKLFNSARGKGIQKVFENPNSTREEFKRALFIAEQEGISMPSIISYYTFKRNSNLVYEYKHSNKYKEDIKNTSKFDNGLNAEENHIEEIKRQVVGEAWNMINGDMPLYSLVMGEYIDKYHNDKITKFKNAYPEDSKEYGYLVRNMSGQAKVKHIINRAESIGNIDSRGLDNRLTLAMHSIPDTDKGLILADRAIDLVKNSTLDGKRKIQLVVGMFENLKKGQFNKLLEDPEFRNKNSQLLQKWVNLNYTLVEDAYDFDEDKLSNKINYVGYGKRTKKKRGGYKFSNPYRPNYKSQSFSGHRPGFSKVVEPLKEFINDPKYSKYLSNNPKGYIDNIDSDIRINPLNFGVMKDYYIYKAQKLMLQSENRSVIKDKVDKTGLGINKKTIKFKKKKKLKIVSKEKGKNTYKKKTIRSNLLFNSPFNYE